MVAVYILRCLVNLKHATDAQIDMLHSASEVSVVKNHTSSAVWISLMAPNALCVKRLCDEEQCLICHVCQSFVS